MGLSPGLSGAIAPQMSHARPRRVAWGGRGGASARTAAALRGHIARSLGPRVTWGHPARCAAGKEGDSGHLSTASLRCLRRPPLSSCARHTCFLGGQLVSGLGPYARCGQDHSTSRDRAGLSNQVTTLELSSTLTTLQKELGLGVEVACYKQKAARSPSVLIVMWGQRAGRLDSAWA